MSSKLTPKQLHFARCVASGMSQAQSYREAYDVGESTKSETIHEAASRLMRKAEIKARVEYLIGQRERAVAASAVSDRERVLSKLRHMLDNAEPSDGNKLRAAELLGKSVGLFRDVVETQQATSTDDLLGELEAMIEAIDSDDANTASDESVPSDQPLH